MNGRDEAGVEKEMQSVLEYTDQAGPNSLLRKEQEESDRKVGEVRDMREVFEEPPGFVVVVRLTTHVSVSEVQLLECL